MRTGFQNKRFKGLSGGRALTCARQPVGAVALVVVAIYFLGLITTNLFGKRLFLWFEGFFFQHCPDYGVIGTAEHYRFQSPKAVEAWNTHPTPL